MGDGRGLGNQLYMYAAALSVNKKLGGLPICALTPENKHSAKSYNDMLNVITVDDTPEIQARIAAAAAVLPKPATFYSKWTDANIINSPSKDKRMPEGFYQNYTAMNAVIPEIRDALFKNEFSKPKYKSYQPPTGSAFMHVRRGDYANLGWLNGDEYYVRALQEIDTHTEIAQIYVLSDDIAWCKQQLLKWKGATKKVIDCKDIPDELEALYFMSQCFAGAILSSSTFSSWGAYFGANRNPKSTIIYPKVNPIAPDVMNPYEFPERWIAV